MRLHFKQRFFSWFDSYDVFDEAGSTVYTVEGQFAWGHCLHILDASGSHVGTVKERVLTLLPKFELYCGDTCLGCISKEFSLFRPRFNVECNGWQIDGDWMEWDYTISNRQGAPVARVDKELFRLTDTYVVDVANPADTLCALMVVLAIDAEKCSRN